MSFAQLPPTNAQQLWEFLVPAVVVIGILGTVIGVAWKILGAMRKEFADKEETNMRLTRLEVTAATADKLNGKLDQIIKSIEKRRGHD